MSEVFANYFNYFTEIEEHFQKARGTGLFLLSPLDWALIESWKNSDIPLEAVLRGIDEAFEKWRARRSRAQMVNSLAFCSQAVLVAAQRMAEGGTKARPETPPPFPESDLRAYLQKNAVVLRSAGAAEFREIAESLEQIIAAFSESIADLEALEQRLSVLEQRLIAIVRARQPEGKALEIRRELDRYLNPYRSKMPGPQLAMLEAQFLDRAALESAGLPRLSLFYMR